MASRGGNRLLTVLTVLLLFTGIPGDENERSNTMFRQTRAAISFIAKFASEQLLSLGLDALMDKITKTDIIPHLNTMLESLRRIEEMFENALNSLEEIKERFTIEEASKIERDLLTFFKRLNTIIQSLKILNGSAVPLNTSTAYGKLKEDIVQFESDVKVVPDLLVKLHSLIIGSGITAAGRIHGLGCDFVSYVIRQKELASVGKYNIQTTVKKINDYRDRLMELQVKAFQLRNGTCSGDDMKCKQEGVQLEGHLQVQFKRFEQCVPQYLKHLAENVNLDNIHVIDPTSNKGLYSGQFTSIVKDGIMDWDKIDSPQQQGVKCLQDDSSGVWSLIKSSGSGYYLKDASGCFLSFDQQFIHYQKVFPTIWADSDRIDRREFLICLPSITPDVATFLFYANSNDRSTTYHLKEVTTGKYLNVHVEKTSVHVEIDLRLVLVLLLDSDKPKPWLIAPEGTYKQPCTDSIAPSLSSAVESQDHGYIGVIAGSSVAGVVAIVIIVICCCVCWKRRNDLDW